MVADVAGMLERFEGRDRLDRHVAGSRFHLLGTSGTVTTLAGVHLGLERYDRRRVDGLWMDSANVDAMVEKLLSWDFQARVANACIGADRADLVLGRLRHPRGDPRGLAVRAAARRRPRPARGHAQRIDGRGRRVAQRLARRGAAMTKKPTKPGAGTRVLKTRIKKKSGLKESSRRWLERHINDPYVQRSKADGYRSRAAYKLIEIDDRHKILKPGARVIDLGAAPGGWCQVAAVRVKSSEAHPHVVGIDYLDMDPVPGASVLQMDFLDDGAPAKLIEALGGEPDIVLSDMAAPTTGHRRTDHIRTMHLCEVAADFAISVLRPGGHFLAKTFQGGTENTLLDLLKRNFRSVHHVKPPASRDESVELYLLAKDFKGRAEDGGEG